MLNGKRILIFGILLILIPILILTYSLLKQRTIKPGKKEEDNAYQIASQQLTIKKINKEGKSGEFVIKDIKPKTSSDLALEERVIIDGMYDQDTKQITLQQPKIQQLYIPTPLLSLDHISKIDESFTILHIEMISDNKTAYQTYFALNPHPTSTSVPFHIVLPSYHNFTLNIYDRNSTLLASKDFSL